MNSARFSDVGFRRDETLWRRMRQIAGVEQFVRDVVDCRVVGAREQRFERISCGKRLALLHRGPTPIRSSRYISNPEPDMPPQKLAQPSPRVVVEDARPLVCLDSVRGLCGLGTGLAGVVATAPMRTR